MTADFAPLGNLPTAPIDRAALVIACDARDRVLLQLRDDFPHVAAPGLWCVFGGGVEGDETLTDAAVREFFEETGIKLQADRLEPLAVAPSSSRTNAVLYVFRSRDTVEVSQVHLAEGAGFGFFTARQLQRLDMVPSTRAFLSHAGLM